MYIYKKVYFNQPKIFVTPMFNFFVNYLLIKTKNIPLLYIFESNKDNKSKSFFCKNISIVSITNLRYK